MGVVMDPERCDVPKERRFSFYDQVHTTGMDIPQPASARAVVTPERTTFRDYAQGACAASARARRSSSSSCPRSSASRATAIGTACRRRADAQLAAMSDADRARRDRGRRGVAPPQFHPRGAAAVPALVPAVRAERLAEARVRSHAPPLELAHPAEGAAAAGAAARLGVGAIDGPESADARISLELSVRESLDVFREHVERDVSNTVPEQMDTREQVAQAARAHGGLLQDVEDVRTIERIQAMLSASSRRRPPPPPPPLPPRATPARRAPSRRSSRQGTLRAGEGAGARA